MRIENLELTKVILPFFGSELGEQVDKQAYSTKCNNKVFSQEEMGRVGIPQQNQLH